MCSSDLALLASMVNSLIDRVRADVPEAPGALYLRPLLFGTMANIGAAATPSNEACLVVLASPVWDYFAGGIRPLKILVEEHAQRCAPHLGMVKTGGNYAAAMGPTLAARKAFGIDQVLFCPGGEVQETGASNFLLIRPGHVLTRSLDSSFLHGVTRDSLLTIARELGYAVEERVFTVDEMLEWVKDGEAALSGTAIRMCPSACTAIGRIACGLPEMRNAAMPWLSSSAVTTLASMSEVVVKTTTGGMALRRLYDMVRFDPSETERERTLQHDLHPRRTDPGSFDRRHHHPDLPDLNLRAGSAGRPQGLRVCPDAEPDARRARGQRRGDRERQGWICLCVGDGR